MDGRPTPDGTARESHHEHPRLHRLAEAAIEAELDTGTREETREEARAHVVVRVARMTIGFLVLGIGLALIPLPGPGWLVVAAGFAVLAKDFVWAERTLERVRSRLPQDADGRISTKTWVVIGCTTTATIAASVWWSFLR